MRTPQTPATTPADLRAAPRRRTPLRPARILGADRRILAEAQIRDLSAGGLRLALADPPAPGARLVLLDCAGERIAEARVVWRRGTLCGLSALRWTAAARY